MALTYGDVSAITEKYFVPKLIDNIFASNALLQRAKNKWYDRVEGGEKCLVPVMYAVTRIRVSSATQGASTTTLAVPMGSSANSAGASAGTPCPRRRCSTQPEHTNSPA